MGGACRSEAERGFYRTGGWLAETKKTGFSDAAIQNRHDARLRHCLHFFAKVYFDEGEMKWYLPTKDMLLVPVRLAKTNLAWL